MAAVTNGKPAGEEPAQLDPPEFSVAPATPPPASSSAHSEPPQAQPRPPTGTANGTGKEGAAAEPSSSRIRAWTSSLTRATNRLKPGTSSAAALLPTPPSSPASPPRTAESREKGDAATRADAPSEPRAGKNAEAASAAATQPKPGPPASSPTKTTTFTLGARSGFRKRKEQPSPALPGQQGKAAGDGNADTLTPLKGRSRALAAAENQSTSEAGPPSPAGLLPMNGARIQRRRSKSLLSPPSKAMTDELRAGSDALRGRAPGNQGKPKGHQRSSSLSKLINRVLLPAHRQEHIHAIRRQNSGLSEYSQGSPSIRQGQFPSMQRQNSTLSQYSYSQGSPSLRQEPFPAFSRQNSGLSQYSAHDSPGPRQGQFPTFQRQNSGLSQYSAQGSPGPRQGQFPTFQRQHSGRSQNSQESTAQRYEPPEPFQRQSSSLSQYSQEPPTPNHDQVQENYQRFQESSRQLQAAHEQLQAAHQQQDPAPSGSGQEGLGGEEGRVIRRRNSSSASEGVPRDLEIDPNELRDFSIDAELLLPLHAPTLPPPLPDMPSTLHMTAFVDGSGGFGGSGDEGDKSSSTGSKRRLVKPRTTGANHERRNWTWSPKRSNPASRFVEELESASEQPSPTTPTAESKPAATKANFVDINASIKLAEGLSKPENPVTPSQQAAETLAAKAEARRRREEIKKTGDWVGMTGADSTPGGKGVLSPTDSASSPESDPSPQQLLLSGLTAARPPQPARDPEAAQLAESEAQARRRARQEQQAINLARIEELRDRVRGKLEEARRERSYGDQQYHDEPLPEDEEGPYYPNVDGPWEEGEESQQPQRPHFRRSQWSSLAEPNLSPIAGSMMSSRSNLEERPTTPTPGSPWRYGGSPRKYGSPRKDAAQSPSAASGTSPNVRNFSRPTSPRVGVPILGPADPSQKLSWRRNAPEASSTDATTIHHEAPDTPKQAPKKDGPNADAGIDETGKSFLENGRRREGTDPGGLERDASTERVKSAAEIAADAIPVPPPVAVPPKDASITDPRMPPTSPPSAVLPESLSTTEPPIPPTSRAAPPNADPPTDTTSTDFRIPQASLGLVQRTASGRSTRRRSSQTGPAEPPSTPDKSKMPAAGEAVGDKGEENDKPNSQGPTRTTAEATATSFLSRLKGPITRWQQSKQQPGGSSSPGPSAMKRSLHRYSKSAGSHIGPEVSRVENFLNCQNGPPSVSSRTTSKKAATGSVDLGVDSSNGQKHLVLGVPPVPSSSSRQARVEVDLTPLVTSPPDPLQEEDQPTPRAETSAPPMFTARGPSARRVPLGNDRREVRASAPASLQEDYSRYLQRTSQPERGGSRDASRAREGVRVTVRERSAGPSARRRSASIPIITTTTATSGSDGMASDEATSAEETTTSLSTATGSYDSPQPAKTLAGHVQATAAEPEYYQGMRVHRSSSVYSDDDLPDNVRKQALDPDQWWRLSQQALPLTKPKEEEGEGEKEKQAVQAAADLLSPPTPRQRDVAESTSAATTMSETLYEESLVTSPVATPKGVRFLVDAEKRDLLQQHQRRLREQKERMERRSAAPAGADGGSSGSSSSGAESGGTKLHESSPHVVKEPSPDRQAAGTSSKLGGGQSSTSTRSSTGKDRARSLERSQRCSRRRSAGAGSGKRGPEEGMARAASRVAMTRNMEAASDATAAVQDSSSSKVRSGSDDLPPPGADPAQFREWWSGTDQKKQQDNAVDRPLPLRSSQGPLVPQGKQDGKQTAIPKPPTTPILERRQMKRKKLAESAALHQMQQQQHWQRQQRRLDQQKKKKKQQQQQQKEEEDRQRTEAADESACTEEEKEAVIPRSKGSSSEAPDMVEMLREGGTAAGAILLGLAWASWIAVRPAFDSRSPLRERRAAGRTDGADAALFALAALWAMGAALLAWWTLRVAGTVAIVVATL